MCMQFTQTRVNKKKIKRDKTPAHILLFADSKRAAMEILLKQNKTLSGFIQEKIDELVKTSKKKEIVFVDCPKYQNTLPLDLNQDPYNYDYPFTAIAIEDDKADVSLSFSLKQKLKFDSL
jgi:hypothetical protein